MCWPAGWVLLHTYICTYGIYMCINSVRLRNNKLIIFFSRSAVMHKRVLKALVGWCGKLRLNRHVTHTPTLSYLWCKLLFFVEYFSVNVIWNVILMGIIAYFNENSTETVENVFTYIGNAETILLFLSKEERWKLIFTWALVSMGSELKVVFEEKSLCIYMTKGYEVSNSMKCISQKQIKYFCV